MISIRPFIQLARPSQYVKNGFVWLPLFFGNKMWDSAATLHTFWAFLSFCLTASSVYAMNDLKDMAQDREHPVKCLRPLARGALNRAQALGFMAVLLALSLGFSLFLPNSELTFILLIYLALNLAYSFFLTHFAIIDVVCISTGFVLRVLAGGFAAEVETSHWIITMTFLLALFLAFAKRRDDLLLLAQGNKCRKSLDGYSLEFISLSMGIMASVIIVCYVLYTVSPEIIAKHGTDQLYLTAFWVILGILRFMQATIVEERSGSPTQVLLKDPFLRSVALLWILSCYVLIYGIGL